MFDFIQRISFNPDSDTPGGPKDEVTSLIGAVNNFLSKYKEIVFGVLAVICVALIIAIMVLLAYASHSGSNPVSRKKCMSALLFSFVALGIFGGLTIFINLFYHIL